MKRFWMFASMLLIAGLAILPLHAADPAKSVQEKPSFVKNSPQLKVAFRPVVAGPSQSTVRIQCDGKDAALGTIVGPDGWILTKASEMKGRIVCTLKDGRQLEARFVGVHSKQDLAMLKIDVQGLNEVVWSESKSEVPGNWVASPGVEAEPVAVGVVSVATRNVRAIDQPRNAGGGGFLGVALESAKGGVKVARVEPGSAAQKAGIVVNDTIVSVNNKAVEDQETLMDILGRGKPGDSVALKIKRGKQDLELRATLGKRPADRGDFQNSLGGLLSRRRGGFTTILQHDSVLRPRDCGGPLVDLDGKVIGINIARAGRTESYAVPSEVIMPLLVDLMSGKLAPKNESAELAPAEKVAKLRAELQKAEAELAAAENVAQARAALQKAEADKIAADKRIAEARAALEKAEAAERGVKEGGK